MAFSKQLQGRVAACWAVLCSPTWPGGCVDSPGSSWRGLLPVSGHAATVWREQEQPQRGRADSRAPAWPARLQPLLPTCWLSHRAPAVHKGRMGRSKKRGEKEKEGSSCCALLSGRDMAAAADRHGRRWPACLLKRLTQHRLQAAASLQLMALKVLQVDTLAKLT